MSVDYPDWTVPQANANSIATTGVPLLTLPTLLYEGTQNIPAATVGGFGPVSIVQPGYDLSISAYSAGAGAAGPISIVFNWEDATESFVVGQQTWYIWPGTAVSNHRICGQGPSDGVSLSVAIDNYSAVMPYDVTIALYARSHPYLTHDWRTVNYNASESGNPVALIDPTAELIGTRAGSIAGGGNYVSELALYSGYVLVHADTGSRTSDMGLYIENSANPNGLGAGGTIQRYQSDANGNINAVAALPRYQCRVVMVNGNAGAQNCEYSVHAIRSA